MTNTITKNILLKWFWWQFFESPKEILKGWGNFLKFGLHFFSIPLLIKTFFSPWRRYKWSYPRGFDAWTYFEIFFSNLISRGMGVIFRTVLIVVGVAFEIFIFFMGFCIFLGWLILPVFLILGIYHGFRILL